MAALTADLMLPGIGSAVQALVKIATMCDDMSEGQRACKRLHVRLQEIMTQFDDMAKRGTLPENEALTKYSDIVRTYEEFLDRHRSKKLFSRLVQHKRMMDELLVINQEVDTLFRILHLATAASLMTWRKEWEEDRKTQQKLMATMVTNDVAIRDELYDMRTQMEGMTRLKHEIDSGMERQPAEIIVLMKLMFSTIARLSRGSVARVPPWYLPPDVVNYVKKPFAVGSFGSVHHGVWGSGTIVVVKCMLGTERGINDRGMQSFRKEVDMWFSFNHPHVIKMFGASHFSLPPYIVCEVATNGNLADFLAVEANRGSTWRLLYQAALGLEYIHGHRIVHGDLKCNNILVSADEQAKLADFGLSVMRSASSSDASAALRATMLMDAANPQEARVSGGLRWKAPECLKSRPTFASDVYSFAMCIFEAVIGEIPFEYLDDDTVRYNLAKGEIPDQPDEMADDVWGLIEQMTQLDPTKRIHLPTVIQKLKSLADREGNEGGCSSNVICTSCFSSHPMKSVFCSRCGELLHAEDVPSRVSSSSHEESSICHVVANPHSKNAGNEVPLLRDVEFMPSIDTDDDKNDNSTSGWRSLEDQMKIIIEARIPCEKVTSDHLLLQDRYFQVYRGRFCGKPVAIKTLSPVLQSGFYDRRNLIAKVAQFTSLRHPRIVQLIGLTWDSPRDLRIVSEYIEGPDSRNSLRDLHIVSEYMEGGDLREALTRFEAERRPHGFDYTKLKIAHQIAHALAYLHSLRPIFVHGDVKSKNVLLDSQLNAKLTDAIGSPIDEHLSDKEYFDPWSTALWMAPEVLKGKWSDEKADVFSLGVMLSELDSHALPYSTYNEGRRLPGAAVIMMVAQGGWRVQFSPNALEDMVTLGRECTAIDPKLRPTAGDVWRRLQQFIREMGS
ncbi:Serine/threonine protein kinase, partial [Globisporangium splendens]